MENKMVGSERSQWMMGRCGKKEGMRVKAEGKDSRAFIFKINLVNKRSKTQKNICLLMCDGCLKALGHMTYPLYKAHGNISIYLFIHLTRLERVMNEIIEESRWEDRRWQQSLSVLSLVFSHSIDIHDKVLMGCSYCFRPFHPFMVSWVHMFIHTNSEKKAECASKWVQVIK